MDNELKTKKQLIEEVDSLHRRLEGLERIAAERRQVINKSGDDNEKKCFILASLPLVTWTFNQDNKIVFVSQDIENICGFIPEELYRGGYNYWLNIIHPEDIDKVKQARQLVFTHNKMFDIEYRVQTKAGRWLWLRDISVSIYKDGDIKYVDGFFSDITTTDRNAVEKLKQDFISVVSHELSTPLAIIKGNVNILMSKITGSLNEKQEKFFSSIDRNIERVIHIITNLLDMSILQGGCIQLEIDQVNIKDLIENVIKLYKSQAKEKGLEIKADYCSEWIYIYADSNKIIQVLSHLVGNAIKFTEKGYVGISVRDMGDEIECSVIDTGTGISKKDLPLMFEKFQQPGRAEGGGERGVGSGLFIAKGFIERHNGKIWIESEFGKYAKVTFTLPKYASEVLFHIGKAIKETKENGEKMSIIVVAIPNLTRLRKELSDAKVEKVLKYIDGILNNCTDIVIKNFDEYVLIFKEYGKEDALRIEHRLREIIGNYIRNQRINDLVEVGFSCAAYPEDSKNAEGLLKRLRNKLMFNVEKLSY